jgi:hypothetical protein
VLSSYGRATVRGANSDEPFIRIASDAEGKFESDLLPAGPYRILIAHPGFASRVLNVVVRLGATTNLGAIRMDIGGCDAPGMICDSIGTDMSPNPRAQGYFELKRDCGMNVETRAVSCPAGAESHLQLREEGSGLYLVAGNGAMFTVIAPARAGAYSEWRVRIDGLNQGIDVVLHTRERHEAHIYFTHDIDRDTALIKLW